MDLPSDDVGPSIEMQAGVMAMAAFQEAELVTPARKPVRMPSLSFLVFVCGFYSKPF